MSRLCIDPVEKFWANVSPEPNSGCWIWAGTTQRNGYGHHRYGGRGGPSELAHRFSYRIHKGEIPNGFDLDHLCRVRCCVNPDHLEPVTRKENINRSGLVGKWKRELGAKRPWLIKTHCRYGHKKEEKYGAMFCVECARISDRKRKRSPTSKIKVFP